MMAADPKSRETRLRLEKCWTKDIDWDLIPTMLKQGCFQVSKALCIPPIAVLGGLVTLTSFTISPAVLKVPNTEWTESALSWVSINMPSGSTKSSLYQYLNAIIVKIRQKCGYTPCDPVWLLGDCTCEKMGDLMALNGGRLLGLYDELSTFLTQLNLYRGKGIVLSHEISLFLQLYNGHSWNRSTVTGDANFSMDYTCLTIGGFSQPTVARTIIEQPGSAEIGIAQRFLWMFPRPTYSRFHTLEAVDENFTDSLVTLLKDQWVPGRAKTPQVRVFTLIPNCKTFSEHFDLVQEQLETLASMDDLLSGMLSKSKGQILRVATALHVLFNIENPGNEISLEITEEAIKAAINFVQLSCQQTAFMAGRGEIPEEIQLIKSSINNDIEEESPDSPNTGAHCLKLPGKQLNLTALLYAKKFRQHGYKKGALNAFKELEASNLGTLETTTTKSGTQYVFIKADVPDGLEEKAELAKKLMRYKISLMEYSSALRQEEIQSPKNIKVIQRKRPAEEPSPDSPIRRSPRLIPKKDS